MEQTQLDLEPHVMTIYRTLASSCKKFLTIGTGAIRNLALTSVFPHPGQLGNWIRNRRTRFSNVRDPLYPSILRRMEELSLYKYKITVSGFVVGTMP